MAASVLRGCCRNTLALEKSWAPIGLAVSHRLLHTTGSLHKDRRKDKHIARELQYRDHEVSMSHRQHPILDIPDYSYVDGRPTELTTGQRSRSEDNYLLAKRVVQLVNEMKFAQEQLVAQENQAKSLQQGRIESRLKSKNHPCFHWSSLSPQNFKSRQSHDFQISRLYSSSQPKVKVTQLDSSRQPKDKVPSNFTLIYENKFNRFMGLVRVIGTAGGLASVGLSLKHIAEHTDTMEFWDLCLFGGVSLFSLLCVGFINRMLQYYLLRIYFDSANNTFICVFYSLLGRRQQMQYSLTDLKSVNTPSPDAVHSKCQVRINGRLFHLQAQDFKLPMYYNMHLGVQ